MYADYFGLDEPPFAITPDPRYLYLGRRHAEALAHLLYGIREGGGFVLLTGEVGTGKTTLTRCLLDELPPEVDVAVLLNPRLDVTEFLEAICQELDIPLPDNGGNRRLVDALNRHLLDAHARGRRTVLIVDEAQNLSPEVLEQVRLLTNLETAKTKLLQILLIGQPELRDIVARQELRQLAQRITARYHLEPLGRAELGAYVSHRLSVAGARGAIFGPKAIGVLWRRSSGIPRRVNILCDRALLGAWSGGVREVSPRLVEQAAREIDGPVLPRERRNGLLQVLLLTGFLLVGGVAAAALLHPALVSDWRRPSPSTPASLPSLADWLAVHADTAGTDDALGVLFREWQLDYVPDGLPACEVARRNRLRCLHDRGNWAALAALDRPAVLELANRAGSRFQVTVTGLRDNAQGTSVVIRAGRAARSVTVEELVALWTGEFLAFWRPPAGIEPPLLPGARGPAVEWLRDSLAERLGPAAETAADPALYDATLVARVREFQRRERLDIDGIAGEQTLIRLNTLLHTAGTPFLGATEN